jgi:hypothetical protein
MKKLNNLVVLITVFSLLCGQAMLMFAQDEAAEATTEKKQLAQQIWVGRGYDITDKYADIDSVREAVFDINTDAEGNPVLVSGEESFPIEIDENPGSKYEEFSGKSLSEYQTSFSNKLSIGGSYKIFSASVSVNFGKNDSSSIAKEYLTMMYTVTERTYRMPFDVKSKVRAEVQEAIDNEDPIALFERFGTHYIWQADVGGRVDYNFTSNRTATQKDFNLQVQAKAALNAVVASISVENETAYSNSLKKINENGSIKVLSYGGSPDAGSKVRQSLAATADWSKSVSENPTLARFTDRSLRGIWTLAKTPARQQAIQKAFANYAKGTEIKDAPSKIVVKRSDELNRVGENWYAKNSQNGSPYTIGIYTPVADTENGWFVVGHSADKNNRPETAATIDSILVKELGESGKLLREPLGYAEVYNDKSTSGAKDWSIWKANCPVGFVALSYFAKYGHDAPNINIPTENPFRDMRCVSESLVEAAPIPTKADLIYNGEGSGGRNIMVYSIKPAAGSNAVDGNFFYAHIPGNYGDPIPTKLRLYVLKNSDAASSKTEWKSSDGNFLSLNKFSPIKTAETVWNF